VLRRKEQRILECQFRGVALVCKPALNGLFVWRLNSQEPDREHTLIEQDTSSERRISSGAPLSWLGEGKLGGADSFG